MNSICPEGYSYVAGHERMGIYIKPHCRKAPEGYDEYVADL